MVCCDGLARASRRWMIACSLLGAAPAAALGAEGAGGPYPGDIGQAIATVATFVVLLWILRRFAWKPIVAQIRHREEAITATIRRAEQKDQEAQELLEHYRSRLEQAEKEAQETLLKARQEAAELRERVLAEARQEAQRASERARAELEEAKRDAMNELCNVAAELATDVAGRLLRKELSPEYHAKLIARSIEEIRNRVSGSAG